MRAVYRAAIINTISKGLLGYIHSVYTKGMYKLMANDVESLRLNFELWMEYLKKVEYHEVS